MERRAVRNSPRLLRDAPGIARVPAPRFTSHPVLSCSETPSALDHGVVRSPKGERHAIVAFVLVEEMVGEIGEKE